MDSSNLQTASTYINNLLLARGLLRNGKPVDFASLASKASNNNEKTTKDRVDTTAHIINVVHDLILRRDRDQEQQETIAQTLYTLRTEATRHTADLDRLNNRNRDLVRQLTQCQSTMRSAQAQCTAAESSARALREEIARAKATLAQVRSQCANDVRKRDLQIQRLKTHLTAQQRGSRTGMIGASITINPGNTGRGNTVNGSIGPDGEEQPNLEDAEYSLKQETTEFLTQLSQGLSDENDALISLIKGALGTLRDLQGLPHNQQVRPKSRGNDASQREAGDEHVQVLSASYDSLAADLGSTLEILRELLTNPSFAPIEEVHLREEEIQRLRDGWEKMEVRWKEAVAMMKGWRERMLSGGNTVDLEELKLGLGLGEGLEGFEASEDNPNDNIEQEQDDQEHDNINEEEEDNIDENMARLPEEEPSFSAPEPQLVLGADSQGISDNAGFLKPDRHLKEVDGNVTGPIGSRKRSRNDSEAHENSADSQGLQANLGLPNVEVRDRSKKARIPSTKYSKASKVPQKTRIPSSKQPSTNGSAPVGESNLSVAEKLRHAESEARRASYGSQPSSPLEFDDNMADDKVFKSDRTAPNGTGSGGSPVRRTGIAGRPQRSRRRKSTLSPEELDNLLLVGANEVA